MLSTSEKNPRQPEHTEKTSRAEEKRQRKKQSEEILQNEKVKHKKEENFRSALTANNQSDSSIDGVNFILGPAHVRASVDAACIRYKKIARCRSTAGESRQRRRRRRRRRRRLVPVRHGHGRHRISISCADEVNDVTFPRDDDVVVRLVVILRRKFDNFRSN